MYTKNCWRRMPHWGMVLTVALTLLQLVPATARPRVDYTKLGSVQHSMTELMNAELQAIIDTTKGWRTLTADTVRLDTLWLQHGELARGYPTLATVVLVCSTGTVSANFSEYYDATADSVLQTDGDNTLFTAKGVGQWCEDIPFLGGKFVVVRWSSSGAAIFHAAYQLMRP